MSSPSTQSSGGPQTASSTPITCSSSTETLNSPSGALASASSSPSVGGTPAPSVAGPPTPVGPTSPLFHRTPNPAPGSTQQPPSAPVMRFPPPQSPAALQPPVPGQSSSTRPSFSYNVSSSSGQQATTSGHLSGGKLTPPTTATLQSTVAGQPIHQNPSVPGAVAPRLQTPTHPPFSASTGPSTAESFSFNSSSQLPTTTEDLHKHSSSNSSTADVAASETRSVLPTSAAPHSASFPAQTSNVASLSGIPGPPGIALSAPLPSMSAVRPAAMNSSSVPPRPTFPSVVSSHTNAIAVGVAPNVAQMIYPPYSSYAAMPQPPQTFWLPPNQVSGFQRPQFLPYPGAVPSPFPVPLHGGHGGPLPSMPIPEPQPPGVSSVVQPPENSLAIAASTQPAGFKAQSPPTGIDYAKEVKEMISKSDEISKKVDADAWTAHKSETGAVYYYNAVTGESTYQKPSSFIGEADKVTVQPTPVSWEKLAGTDWVLVATNDGKKYYYNSKSKISSWQVPPEVAELRKKQDADSAKANATSAQESNLSSLDAPAVITGGRDAVSLRSSVAPMSSSQVELVKKKLHDASTPVTSSPVPASSAPLTSIDLNDPKAVEPTLKGQHSENSKERPKDAGGDGNVSESSSDADDVDSGPKKEDYIFQFKEMLKERGVAPFSKWDKELPKILFDPRFKAVPGYDTRKALFEQFVKTRAEEERKEKRAAQKAAVEGFKQLLEEASEEIDHKTDYETFKRKWGSDPRFGALDRKERELLLNERVLPLKKAVEERIQATRAAAVSSFKSMLRDNKNITINSRWSRVKDGLRGDPRYKSVKHEDREVLFNEYISELKGVEDEKERAVKAKREEQEKLKEREREMRKRKEREELEMERIRSKVRRTGAVSSYQALLVEIIKDPKASWTESKPKLEKDPQGRAMNPDLDPVDMEKLFREHVRSLQERLEKDFCTLLSEVITPEAASQTTEDGKTILTSWSAAKRLLRSDPRYLKLSSKDRESLWNRYADKMQRKMKLESGANAERPNTEIRHRTPSESARRSPRRNNYGRR